MRITDDEIIRIKNEILKETDHDNPPTVGLIEALNIGAEKFSKSPLAEMMRRKDNE